MKLNVPGLSVEDVGSTGIIVVFRWTCVVVSSRVVVNGVILISDVNDEVPDEVIWLDIGRSATVVVVNGIGVVGVTVDIDILDLTILDEADGTGLMTGDSVVIGFSSIVVSDEGIDVFATGDADVDGSNFILDTGDDTSVAPDDGSIDVLVSSEVVAAGPASVDVNAIVDVAASEVVSSFISGLAVLVDSRSAHIVDPAR